MPERFKVETSTETCSHCHNGEANMFNVVDSVTDTATSTTYEDAEAAYSLCWSLNWAYGLGQKTVSPYAESLRATVYHLENSDAEETPALCGILNQARHLIKQYDEVKAQEDNDLPF